MWNLKARYTSKELAGFAREIKELSSQIGFKISSRGWCYILEQNRFINKDQFDKVQTLINNCRKKGHLPIDFVAEETGRQFQNIEIPTSRSIVQDFRLWLECSLDAADRYNVNWWEGEKYYLQMVVEKVDLVTLFLPICKKYHLPIANARGWSSMLQRATYAKRFQEAYEKGMQPVLLYCGDHDPDGLRISDFLRKNLYDLQKVHWSDGTEAFDPCNLKIVRFGLNYEFIAENNLTWIDNLITGSGKNLASPEHRNYHMPYVQEYLTTIGEKKCEANAIVTMPQQAKELVEQAIQSFLGKTALRRFAKKRKAVVDEFNEYLEKSGVKAPLQEIIDDIYKNWD